jgi:hypothetical protein
VTSTQPTFYPGTECFWIPNRNFFGWARYPFGHPPTAYYDNLILNFDCFSFSGSNPRVCSDFGVVR